MEDETPDYIIVRQLREKYSSLDEKVQQNLSNYGKRVLLVEDEERRETLLDHLVGLYEMGGRGEDYRLGIRFLERALNLIDERRAKEILSEHERGWREH